MTIAPAVKTSLEKYMGKSLLFLAFIMLAALGNLVPALTGPAHQFLLNYQLVATGYAILYAAGSYFAMPFVGLKFQFLGKGMANQFAARILAIGFFFAIGNLAFPAAQRFWNIF